LLCSAPRRTTARARCVHRSRRRTGGQTVRVRVVRSESVGFPCTPAAVALSFVAPAGAAARQRRCRLFIPLFAQLRMSWSDSDEDDRVRTATAHDRSRRRTYPYAVGRGSDCSTQPRRAGCLRLSAMDQDHCTLVQCAICGHARTGPAGGPRPDPIDHRLRSAHDGPRPGTDTNECVMEITV